ncbi:hypothetical protein D083_2997 [Dickeya solani RNS 08.23.3.1.A]|nr:hypothetical protein D083_2997 [Dickeya solani RNS 08.23.3.1.A]
MILNKFNFINSFIDHHFDPFIFYTTLFWFIFNQKMKKFNPFLIERGQ